MQWQADPDCFFHHETTVDLTFTYVGPLPHEMVGLAHDSNLEQVMAGTATRVCDTSNTCGYYNGVVVGRAFVPRRPAPCARTDPLVPCVVLRCTHLLGNRLGLAATEARHPQLRLRPRGFRAPLPHPPAGLWDRARAVPSGEPATTPHAAPARADVRQPGLPRGGPRQPRLPALPVRGGAPEHTAGRPLTGPTSSPTPNRPPVGGS
ncbi:hypothetical protein GCM10010492_53460 [Saccharothrix mutabilis subsp. mutabilis]|uniref:Uncharacterized protein n=1 Tax=Saccharothrix mutabilis subsp. mutabilis TaxID=66855 RepID=A0ABN0UDP8_9PSEU